MRRIRGFGPFPYRSWFSSQVETDDRLDLASVIAPQGVRWRKISSIINDLKGHVDWPSGPRIMVLESQPTTVDKGCDLDLILGSTLVIKCT